MRANSIIVLGGVGILLVVIEEGMGSLMLAPLIMALKGGMFAGKMGLGGMLAMFLATTQNVHTQQGYNAGYTARDQEGSLSIAGLTKKKRTIRSIPQSVFDTKLDLTTDGDGSANNGTLNLNGTEDHLSAEKLAAALNNISSPASQRVMRQVAILDQLSCLPKVICGLNTKEPSQKTSVINDYGYLIKYLFERDDDADDADQDDEEADDEEDDALSRAAETMLRKKSGQSSPIKSGPNTDKLKKKKKKPSSSSAEDDYDEDTEDSDEVKIDEAEFDDIPDEDESLDEKFEEMAQDELIDDEPEMLKYALAEMKHKMNKHRSKYAVDHSHVPGYDKGSYHTEQNPLLNTKSAQEILRTTPKHKNGLKGVKGRTKAVVSNVATNLADKGVKVGNKRFQFQFGAKDSGVGSDESSPSLFGSILPSFIYDKIRADPEGGGENKYRTKDPSDPFADDPFFDGFRRNLKFPPEDMQKSESNPAEQRTNSKFTKAEEDEAKYMARKARQLAKAKNPLTKYRVAKQVGEKTKNSRQCRMLFAKCPYEFNEIMTMINNVKKLLNEQAIVGDKEVLLKQPAAGPASIADVLGSTTSLMGGTGVNLQTGQAGSTGITHISQQLANGDNVEIMLKIKPKGPVEKYSSTTAAEIAAANKSLQDMKKAIQAIAKLHNTTEYGGSGTQQFQFIQPSEIIAAAKVVSNAAPSTTLKTTATKSTSTSTWKPVPVLKFEENTSQSEPSASPSTLAEVAPGFSGESTSSSQETSSEEASSIKQKQTNIRNKIKDLQSQPKPSANPKPQPGPGSASGSASGSKEEDEEGDDDQEEEDEDDEDTLDDSPVPSRHHGNGNGGGHHSGNGGYNGGHHHDHGHGHGHGTHNFGPGEGPPPFLDDPNYHGEHDDDDDNTEISFSFRQQPIKKNKRPPPSPPKPQNSNSGPVYIDFDISSKSPPPSPTYSTISGAKMRPPAPLPTRPAPYRIIRNKNSNNNGGGR